MAGEHSTTEPPMLTYMDYIGNYWIDQFTLTPRFDSFVKDLVYKIDCHDNMLMCFPTIIEAHLITQDMFTTARNTKLCFLALLYTLYLPMSNPILILFCCSKVGDSISELVFIQMGDISKTINVYTTMYKPTQTQFNILIICI